MSARDLVIDVLLALTVASAALSCAGILVMRRSLARLHYVGPLVMVCPVLAGIAVAIGKHPYAGSGFKALFIAAVLVLFGPMLTHQTGQMIEARGDR